MCCTDCILPTIILAVLLGLSIALNIALIIYNVYLRRQGTTHYEVLYSFNIHGVVMAST